MTIDVGYLYNVRINMQNGVDAIALASASALSGGPDDVWNRARRYANLNTANGSPIQLQSEDVQLGYWDSEFGEFTPAIGGEARPPDAVRVSAHLTSQRGNAVSLFFAPAMGHQTSDVSATATATFGTADAWDVMIVQDISGSFTGALSLAKEADEALVSCLRDHTDNSSRLGFVRYTGTADVVTPLEAIETGFDNLVYAIRNLSSCSWWGMGGAPTCSTGTNIAAGVDVAVNEFLNATPPDSDIGQAIVIISDGRPQSVGSGGLSAQVLRDMAVQSVDDAWSAGISVYAVYYAGSSSTPQADADFLATLVRGSGTFEATPDAADLSTMLWNVCSSLPLMLVE